MSRTLLRPRHRQRRSPRVLYRYPNTWAQTFGRSTIASYRKAGGVLAEAAPGELRDRHFVRNPEGVLVPSRLLEGGRTNKLTRSEELDHTDWTKSNATVTANATTAPDGSSTADKIVENSTTSAHIIQQQVAGDQTGGWVSIAHVKAAERASAFLQINAKGNPDALLQVIVSLNDGTVSTENVSADTTKQVVNVVELNDGWYEIQIGASALNTAADDGDIEVAVGPSDGNTIYAGDGSSGIYAWGLQLENASFPSSYIETTTAAASRDADLLQDTFPVTPAEIEQMGGLTVLSEWVELGTGFTGSAGPKYWHIGGPNNGDDPRMLLNATGSDGGISGSFDPGTAASSSLGGGTISLFDHVRARQVVFKDGSDWKIQLHVSVNGGAETSATATTIGPKLTAGGKEFSQQLITFNAAPDDTLHGYGAHIQHVFVEGPQPLDVMLRAA